MTDVQPLVFNPLQPGYIENPHLHLAEMREQDPVHESLFASWILFRHEDVARLLRDPGMSVDESNMAVVNQERYEAFVDAYGGEAERSTSRLFVDPPDHTRLRKLLSKAFTPSTIEG